jgi:iron complex outermembrane receptor protein
MAQSSGDIERLKQLSIDELAGADVTTASRRTERLADVAAAVSVITGDDLRRAGVLNLAQALRLADSLQVAQVSGPQWAISARGFNISTANKMLVLIDGRTVYTPVFAGVFWEAQDLFVPDIDRIEVTRGPGGSVWGANAVNGVINVITKRAADTRGTLLFGASGSNVIGPFGVRHGGRLGSAGSFRTYAKVRFEDSHQLLSGADAQDDFDFGQMGFRLETAQTDRSFAVFQGDVYTGITGLTGGAEARIAGGNLLARYTHGGGGQPQTQVQVYYDRTYRRVPQQYRGVLNTIDVDAHHTRAFTRHTLVAGTGYRAYRNDDLGDGPGFYFDPRKRVSHRFNLFAQDEFAVTRRVFLTVGSKLERNEFTGFELQPTARLRWSGARQSVWTSVSRAVRVPTRFDTDLRFNIPNTATLFLTGSADFKSEQVVAYEAGYRGRLRDRFSVDVAVFNNRYDDLRSQEPPTQPGQPIVLRNMLNAVTKGVEVSGNLQITTWWQAHGSYTHGWQEFTYDAGSKDPTRGTSEANDPRNLFSLRSHVTTFSRLELDGFFRFVGALPQPAVEAYRELDARIGWRLKPGWDLALIGTNLLSPRHLEFRAGTQPETYERAVSLRTAWRF